MANNTFEFTLTANNKGLKKALEESIDNAGKLEGALSSALGVFGGGLALKGVELLGSGIGKLSGFALESVDAFAEQEDALNKLGQALRSTGAFSEEAVASVADFAAELQKASRFGDETIIAQVAFAKSLGATTAQAKALVQAAANLSATLGGSLEENVDKLGKTLSGTTGRLAQYIPELKNLTEEQLRAGAAADIINSKYGGAAANDLKTYSGSIQATKNAFSDLQEEIGQLLAKNPLTVNAIDLTKKALEGLGESVRSINSALTGNAGFLKLETTVEGAAAQLKNLDTEVEKLKQTISDKQLEESVDIATQGFSRQTTVIAGLEAELAKLQNRQQQVNDQLQFGKLPNAPAEQQRDNVSEEEKKKGAARIAEIKNINAQILAERANFQIQSQNEDIQYETAKNLAEIERIRAFELEKAALKKELDLAQATEKLTGQELADAQAKINAENELNQLRINNEAKLKEQKLYNQQNQKQNEEADKFKEKRRKEQEQATADSLSRIATLQSESNKTLATIGKAAALTQIAIDGPAAVVNAYKNVPYPFNIPAAAGVAAAVAAQAARVAGVQFEDGGFVGGLNGGSVGADNRVATIRDGEMILNANDQKNLLTAIKNNTMGSGGDIIIQINGREIARAVREEIRSGFQLA
jgi:hypothetical protein